MDKNTFGNSKAAINLVIALESSEYQVYRQLSCRRLQKQIEALKALLFIPDKNTCETALKLWNKDFSIKINSTTIPEIIKSHILCVATGYFRKYLAISKEGIL